MGFWSDLGMKILRDIGEDVLRSNNNALRRYEGKALEAQNKCRERGDMDRLKEIQEKLKYAKSIARDREQTIKKTSHELEKWIKK